MREPCHLVRYLIGQQDASMHIFSASSNLRSDPEGMAAVLASSEPVPGNILWKNDLSKPSLCSSTVLLSGYLRHLKIGEGKRTDSHILG